VRPWLLTIARRVVADEIASRQRQRVLVSHTEQRTARELGAPDPAAAVASHGLLKHLEHDRAPLSS
jgi:DNA-directed RNA polymerase specialized sigma24 family protein